MATIYNRLRFSALIPKGPISLSLVFLLALLSSCGRNGLTTATSNDTHAPPQTANTPSEAKGSEVSIESIEFFSWWWSQEQMEAGFDIKNPPAKNTYLKLEQWEKTARRDTPHPDMIDAVCKLKNTGDKPADFIVEGNEDYLIAPLYEFKREDMDTIADKVSFAGKVKRKPIVVRDLAAGETKEIKFENFDLRSHIEMFSGSEKSDYMWMWKFRVSIFIKKPNGELIGKGHTILSLFPVDSSRENQHQ